MRVEQAVTVVARTPRDEIEDALPNPIAQLMLDLKDRIEQGGSE